MRGFSVESVRRFEHHTDGIDWYCEQRGDGPPVVLVPSGGGDCASFDQAAAQLANQFSVLTFDMPGFSRSHVRSPEDIRYLNSLIRLPISSSRWELTPPPSMAAALVGWLCLTSSSDTLISFGMPLCTK